MKTKFVVASVAAMLAATPAFAQDDTNFHGGARIEGRVGLDEAVVSVDGDSGSKAGVVYGAEAGYDVVMSGWVLGAYAGIEGATTKECDAVFGNDRACLKASRNITAGVRAGAIVGRGLLYAKGGYSNGRARLTYEDFSTPANNFADGESLDGFHLGAGYEHNISRNTYAKLEYVFTKYSVRDDLGVDVGLQRHQAVAGFGFRF